ncbi:MAG: GGDEF domain-containing protein [Acidobacteriota bacterium]
MANNAVISLDIRQRAREGDQVAIAALLNDVLALLRDFLANDEEVAWRPLAERLEACRSALESGVPPAEIEELTKGCLSEGRLLLEQLQHLRAQRMQDSMAVVEALREVVSTIGAEMSTMHTSITKSTERFEAIGLLTNPQQIKARLMAEVLALKQVAAKRRRAWEETAKTLSQRVAALERDLSVVKGEAATDPLTGIANRRGFDETCERWITLSRPNFVLAILDVDDFKHINDSLGHAAGDDVLRYVAKLLMQSFRADDLVARVGGDEFAVLAADLTMRQAEQRIASVLARISKPDSSGEERPGTVPTLSCGLAEYSAGDTPASLFERADEAQYTAKRQGKNRVVAKETRLLRDLARH